jgi:peroxiredoxin
VSTPQSGERFPDLELPDHTGNLRRLSELAAGDPLYLNFFRGWWCPEEQAFFRRLVPLQVEAEVAYTRFASISVDPPEVAAAFRAGVGARWTFLCDPDRRDQADLDLLETTDTVHRPYVPASFLLFPDLTVHESWNG